MVRVNNSVTTYRTVDARQQFPVELTQGVSSTFDFFLGNLSQFACFQKTESLIQCQQTKEYLYKAFATLYTLNSIHTAQPFQWPSSSWTWVN